MPGDCSGTAGVWWNTEVRFIQYADLLRVYSRRMNQTKRTALIPCLRYKNAPAAIDFLCRAFGFEKHAVHADPKDPTIVHHAQLVLGDAMVMLGSAVPGEMQER